VKTSKKISKELRAIEKSGLISKERRELFESFGLSTLSKKERAAADELLKRMNAAQRSKRKKK
jgi:hypothetical protein